MLARLNVNATTAEINQQLKNQIEPKLKALDAKIKLNIDDSALKTLSEFNKVMSKSGNSLKELNQIQSEYITTSKQMDGSIKKVTQQHLKSGEIIQKESTQIKKQAESVKDLTGELEKLGNAQKKITRTNATGKVIGGSVTNGDDIKKVTVSMDAYGKKVITVTENIGKQEAYASKLKSKLSELGKEGLITTNSISRMSNAIDTSKSVNQFKKLEDMMKRVQSRAKDSSGLVNYQKEMALAVTGIKSSKVGVAVDSTALDTFLNKVKSLSSTTPQLKQRMAELNLELKQIKSNANVEMFKNGNNEKALQLELRVRALREQLKSLNNQGLISSKTMSQFSNGINVDRSVAQLKRLEDGMKKIQSNANTSFNLGQYQSQANLNVQNLQSSGMGKFADSSGMDRYLSSVKALTASTPQLKQRMAELDAEFKKIQADARTAGNETQTFGNQMMNAFSKFAIWGGVSTVFYGGFRTAKQFMDIIIDIDTQMTSLQKVMSADTDFAGVFDRATSSAEQFGQSISRVLDSYVEFSRQGFKGEELGGLADAALVASNTGEIEAGRASEYLTSAIIQWKKESADAMSIIDSYNEISNNYAFW